MELDREIDGRTGLVHIHVPFNVAQLAKIKGFDLLTDSVYDGDPESEDYQFMNHNWNDCYLSDHWKDWYLVNPHFVPAPSQAVLQMWLKDEFDIDVWAQPFVQLSDGSFSGLDGTYTYFVFQKGVWKSDGVDFDDLHSAMDAGLMKALKLI
jgi:hypothetical protein